MVRLDLKTLKEKCDEFEKSVSEKLRILESKIPEFESIRPKCDIERDNYKSKYDKYLEGTIEPHLEIVRECKERVRNCEDKINEVLSKFERIKERIDELSRNGFSLNTLNQKIQVIQNRIISPLIEKNNGIKNMKERLESCEEALRNLKNDTHEWIEVGQDETEIRPLFGTKRMRCNRCGMETMHCIPSDSLLFLNPSRLERGLYYRRH